MNQKKEVAKRDQNFEKCLLLVILKDFLNGNISIVVLIMMVVFAIDDYFC